MTTPIQEATKTERTADQILQEYNHFSAISGDRHLRKKLLDREIAQIENRLEQLAGEHQRLTVPTNPPALAEAPKA